MMPRLGTGYPNDIDVTSKLMADYQTDAFFGLDLPVAPAATVGDAIIVEGKDVSEYEVETEICRQLGISEPEASKKEMRGCLLKKT